LKTTPTRHKPQPNKNDIGFMKFRKDLATQTPDTYNLRHYVTHPFAAPQAPLVPGTVSEEAQNLIYCIFFIILLLEFHNFITLFP
jgi:hypothetical protein